MIVYVDASHYLNSKKSLPAVRMKCTHVLYLKTEFVHARDIPSKHQCDTSIHKLHSRAHRCSVDLHTGTGKFGSGERELIVRRTVSLTPSAPRFARVGDVFEAGAVVTVSGSSTSLPNVTVKLELDGLSVSSLKVVGDPERILQVGLDGVEEVRFQLKAIKMGEASFKISAGEPIIDCCVVICICYSLS